jgi:hypothetical protein
MSLVLVGFGVVMLAYAGVLVYLAFGPRREPDPACQWVAAHAGFRATVGIVAVVGGTFIGASRGVLLAIGCLILTDVGVLHVARHYLPSPRQDGLED